MRAPTTSVPAPAEVSRTWVLPENVKTLTVNGYEMAYTERGSGLPLVLVHGAGLDFRYWAGQMEPFSAKYRTIAVSLRHYYPEPWRGDGEFSLNEHVADLIAFIKQLGDGLRHRLPYTRPVYSSDERLHAAINVALGELSSRRANVLSALLLLARVTRGEPWHPHAPFRKHKRLGNGRVGGHCIQGNGSTAGVTNKVHGSSRQVLRDNAWTLVAGQLDSARWPALGCEDTKRLTLPVLLVGGANSLPRWHLLLDKFQSCLQRAERVVIPDAGHAMSFMNPAAFNAAVLAFLHGK